MTVTSESRHATGSAVILNHRRTRVLLVLHKASGFWQFPGGHVEANESPDEAAVREAREETGLYIDLLSETPKAFLPGQVILPRPLFVTVNTAPAKTGRPGKEDEPEHRHIDFLYTAVADERQPLRTDEGVKAARWFHFEDAATTHVARDLGIRADVPAVLQVIERDGPGW